MSKKVISIEGLKNICKDLQLEPKSEWCKGYNEALYRILLAAENKEIKKVEENKNENNTKSI